MRLIGFPLYLLSMNAGVQNRIKSKIDLSPPLSDSSSFISGPGSRHISGQHLPPHGQPALTIVIVCFAS